MRKSEGKLDRKGRQRQRDREREEWQEEQQVHGRQEGEEDEGRGIIQRTALASRATAALIGPPLTFERTLG